MIIIRYLQHASTGLNHVLRVMACISMVIMVGLICLQVVARYGFSSPPPWTEEAARYAMVWVGLLGGSVSFYERFDPALFKGEAIRNRVLSWLTSVVRAMAVVIFLGPILWYCIFGPGMNPARGFLLRNLRLSAETFDMSMIFVAITVPIFVVACLFHGTVRLLTVLSGATAETAAPNTTQSET